MYTCTLKSMMESNNKNNWIVPMYAQGFILGKKNELVKLDVTF